MRDVCVVRALQRNPVDLRNSTRVGALVLPLPFTRPTPTCRHQLRTTRSSWKRPRLLNGAMRSPASLATSLQLRRGNHSCVSTRACPLLVRSPSSCTATGLSKQATIGSWRVAVQAKVAEPTQRRVALSLPPRNSLTAVQAHGQHQASARETQRCARRPRDPPSPKKPRLTSTRFSFRSQESAEGEEPAVECLAAEEALAVEVAAARAAQREEGRVRPGRRARGDRVRPVPVRSSRFPSSSSELALTFRALPCTSPLRLSPVSSMLLHSRSVASPDIPHVVCSTSLLHQRIAADCQATAHRPRPLAAEPLARSQAAERSQAANSAVRPARPSTRATGTAADTARTREALRWAASQATGTGALRASDSPSVSGRCTTGRTTTETTSTDRRPTRLDLEDRSRRLRSRRPEGTRLPRQSTWCTATRRRWGTSRRR